MRKQPKETVDMLLTIKTLHPKLLIPALMRYDTDSNYDIMGRMEALSPNSKAIAAKKAQNKKTGIGYYFIL